MQEEPNDSKTFDVQYSIRLPEDLATEINTRAAAEGVKPSTWIRNCITSAIKQKNELNADMLRTPLLMLLKRDKSVRAIIKEITSEKLPEKEQLKEQCQNLTASIGSMYSCLDHNEKILERLCNELERAEHKITLLTKEIGVLKQISHGSENNSESKEMIAKALACRETLIAERNKLLLHKERLENVINKDKALIEEMKEENIAAMKKLDTIERRFTVPLSREDEL